MKLLIDILAVFSVTTLWTGGEIFAGPREVVQSAYSRLAYLPPVSWLVSRNYNYRFAECFLCTGFWVALVYTLTPVPEPVSIILAIHGGAYFLRAMQPS